MTTRFLNDLLILFTGKRVPVIGQRSSGTTMFPQIVCGLPVDPPEATVGSGRSPQDRNRHTGTAVRRGAYLPGAKPTHDL